MIDPDAGAAQWDVLVVAGMTSPGVVTLSGNDLKIGWDIQNATGIAGAITKRTGAPIKEFDAEFHLVNDPDVLAVSDFDRWDDFQTLLESSVPNNGKPRALDVFHPDLARNHITAVTLGSIGGAASDGSGGVRIKVHFLEYRPPKPSQPVSSTKTEGDKQIDEDVAKIKALQDEYHNT